MSSIPGRNSVARSFRTCACSIIYQSPSETPQLCVTSEQEQGTIDEDKRGDRSKGGGGKQVTARPTP
jgi:hypothetical protein